MYDAFYLIFIAFFSSTPETRQKLKLFASLAPNERSFLMIIAPTHSTSPGITYKVGLEVFIFFSLLWYLLILWHENLFLYFLNAFLLRWCSRACFMNLLRFTALQTVFSRLGRFIKRKIKHFKTSCLCLNNLTRFLTNFWEFLSINLFRKNIFDPCKSISNVWSESFDKLRQTNNAKVNQNSS